ncbi:hypothetical protein IEE94_06260 [Yimella sp. cx-573]|nr:hypothetical protein [Yimella sp. cx-573]
MSFPAEAPADPHPVARRLASVVPRLLAVQPEAVTGTTTDTINQALEQVAEALLSWHDAMFGGPLPQLTLADEIDPEDGFRPLGSAPPDCAGLSAAGYDLRRIGRLLQGIVDDLGDESLRMIGQRLTDMVEALASALSKHAEDLRGLVPGGSAPADTRAARVARAERILQRQVLAILRA